jgi:hypothetical protein
MTLKDKGEMAMQIMSDHPLYASTCGITYEEAIAIARVLVPDGDFKGYLDEMDRLDGMTADELKKELEMK